MQAWMPSADRNTLLARADMNQLVRDFFQKRDVLEVETPALSQFANTDPSIESFEINADKQARYLHTSPEYPMKRLLAAGSGDIYQISKVWRSGECGNRHNPEFTMLEWYRVGFDYQQLMQEVDELLSMLNPQLASPSVQLSYQQTFLETININPHIATDDELDHAIKQQRLDIIGTLDRSAKLDLLMTHCVESSFHSDRLTFIYDYPAEQGALACIREASTMDNKPAVAERFEVYIGDLELANGYQELRDSDANAAVLQKETRTRQQHGQKNVPKDIHFLAAMAHGLPQCSGVAIGLDRLLMAKLEKKSIQDVISFPWVVA